MITCPRCGKSKDVISEPPSWNFYEGVKQNKDIITIDNYCITCRINFDTTHDIGEQITTEIREENVNYPW